MRIQGKRLCVFCEVDPYYPECVVFCRKSCMAFNHVTKGCDVDRLRREA